MNATPSETASIFQFKPPTFEHPAAVTAEAWAAVTRGCQFDYPLDAVARALVELAEPSGRCASPGRKKISEVSGVPPEEVSRALRALRDMQLLELLSGEIFPGQVGFRYWFRVSDEKAGLVTCEDKERDAARLSELERDLLLKPAEELAREGIGITLDAIPGVPTTHDELPDCVIPRPGKPKPSKRKGIRRRETVLYRYYDDQGVLLYVGITANMPSRFGSHETDSTWMDFAVRSTIERFTNRDDALAAEKAAIEEHAPLFNVEHNDRPDRVRRIVDYLIERDRRDLLVPLISRG